MKPLRPIAMLAVLLVGGCNLAEPAGNYEYQGPFLVITTDQGPTPDDADMREPDDMSDVADIPPPGSPYLIFTELLIDSKVSQPGLGERGEYIELKNVGNGPADPTNIVMVLSDPSSPDVMTGRIAIAEPATSEEIEVVSSLKPIMPGEYFVFVRFETSDVPVSSVVGPGRTYDHGRFASGPALVNSGPRQIELRYNESGVIETFDTVRWEGGNLVAPDGSTSGPSIEPDVALGVDGDAENADDNDDPKNWCPHVDTIEGGTAFGSPGSPVDCGAG